MSDDCWSGTLLRVSRALDDPEPSPRKANARRIHPDRICLQCQRPFAPHNPNDPAAGKFCSSKCAGRWQHEDAQQRKAKRRGREYLDWLRPMGTLLVEARQARAEIQAGLHARHLFPSSFQRIRPDATTLAECRLAREEIQIELMVRGK